MLYNPTPTLIRLLFSFSCLLFIAVYGAAMLDNPLSVNLLARHLPPDAMYWFGTDNLGRDLWVRCFQSANWYWCGVVQRFHCVNDGGGFAHTSASGCTYASDY